MSIQFEVIDLNCQSANESFFIPRVILSGKSTTSYATLYGYNEFGTPSSPPKKYRKVTVSGYSLRVGFTGEQVPQQCGGAKYVWSGVGEVDFSGHQIQNYSKKFFAECSKQFWPLEGIQNNPNAIYSGNFPHQFVGFCWPDEPNSCDTCDSNEANWPFLGNKSTNNPSVDMSGFLRDVNSPVVTKTSYTVNNTFYGLTSIVSEVPYTFTNTGFTYTVTVGGNTYPAEKIITNPDLNFPHMTISGYEGGYIVFTDTNAYSAVLSEEYTDADAAAHATVVVGTGKTAQNMPRTTGFTSVTTTVVYTLDFVNLISGETYTATVDLWDQSEDNFGAVNIHTLKTYTFTATGATHSILDTIPTPDPFHTITVNKPTVAFAT